MPDLKITKFGGLVPRERKANLPIAKVCLDVDLSHHTLRPFYTDKLVGEPLGVWTDGNCCFVESERCQTSVAADGQFVVSTDLFDFPVVGTYEMACAGQWDRLGFPVDLPAPLVQTVGAPREDFNRELRQYVYTLMNEWGWESPPSEVSEPLVADNDFDVVLSGIPARFDGWNVSAIRVYCAVSGLDYGTANEQKDADFLLVGEMKVGSSAFVHRAHTVYGDLLVSDEYLPPSDCLTSIQYCGNGQWGGIVGKELWLSEPHLPYAWNEKYRYGRFRSEPIRFLCGENIGYVLTDGYPATVEMNSSPSEFGCREIHVLEETLPLVSYRSAALWNGSCVYASRDGLVMLSGNNARVVSSGFWTAEQWRLLQPQTMRGAVHDGWYFGSTDNVCFRMKLPDTIHEQMEHLGYLSIQADNWFRADDDKLYFSNSSGTYQWNSGDSWKPFAWGGLLQASGYTAFTAYKLELDYAPVHIVHRANMLNHDVVIGDKTVCNRKPNRLKAGHNALEMEVLIRGTGEVTEYHLATSISELGVK